MFRTELQFMVASDLSEAPRRRRNRCTADVLDSAGKKPVTFRTLDIGGDKALPYFRRCAGRRKPGDGLARHSHVAGPSGTVCAPSCAALLKASAAGRELRVMLPMITEICGADVAAREIIDREVQAPVQICPISCRAVSSSGRCLKCRRCCFNWKNCTRHVDFVSVGSNDLFQFMSWRLTAGAAHLSDRYDPMTDIIPARRCKRHCRSAADKAGKPVTLCGELAGKPLTAMALDRACGFRSLSMSASAVGPVKAMLLGLDVAALEGRNGSNP